MGIKDVVLLAFNSDPVVFAHVLLNPLDMKGRGGKVKVVMEGVCRACAQRNTVVPAVVEQELRLLDEMSGHPSVARYIGEEFTVLVF